MLPKPPLLVAGLLLAPTSFLGLSPLLLWEESHLSSILDSLERAPIDDPILHLSLAEEGSRILSSIHPGPLPSDFTLDLPLLERFVRSEGGDPTLLLPPHRAPTTRSPEELLDLREGLLSIAFERARREGEPHPFVSSALALLDSTGRPPTAGEREALRSFSSTLPPEEEEILLVLLESMTTSVWYSRFLSERSHPTPGSVFEGLPPLVPQGFSFLSSQILVGAALDSEPRILSLLDRSRGGERVWSETPFISPRGVFIIGTPHDDTYNRSTVGSVAVYLIVEPGGNDTYWNINVGGSAVVWKWDSSPVIGAPYFIIDPNRAVFASLALDTEGRDRVQCNHYYVPLPCGGGSALAPGMVMDVPAGPGIMIRGERENVTLDGGAVNGSLTWYGGVAYADAYGIGLHYSSNPNGNDWFSPIPLTWFSPIPRNPPDLGDVDPYWLWWLGAYAADNGVGIFLDKGGNDTMVHCECSWTRAGIAVHKDGGGKDYRRLTYDNVGFGYVSMGAPPSSPFYYLWTSLAIFEDLGGSNDTYLPGFDCNEYGGCTIPAKNDAVWFQGFYGRGEDS